MANWNLTTGSLEKIMAGDTINKPILQILGFKTIAAPSGPDRYRLLLSDGIYTVSSAMLATQMNDKITSNEMDTNCVVRLEKFICNLLSVDKRVIVLLDVIVIASGTIVGGKLGNPQPYKMPLEAVNGQSNASAATNLSSNRPNTSQMNSKNVTNTSNSTHSSAFEKFSPISMLTPYQNRWSIKARVTQKSTIKTWSNSRGEGKLFSFTLLDESGEIRVTAFKNEADKFYNMIEVNKIYILRKGLLKSANKQYSSCNNDYEMTLTADTEIVQCEEAGDSMPTISFNFTPLDSFEQMEANTLADVIGVVKEVGELKSVMTKATNKELKKRDIIIVDEKLFQMRVTMWGEEAENFEPTNNPVLAMRGCKISDWGGKSLSLLNNSQIIVNPNIPECHRLRAWYDRGGASASFNDYKGAVGLQGNIGGVWKMLNDIKMDNLSRDKGEYALVKASIIFMKKEKSTDCDSALIPLLCVHG